MYKGNPITIPCDSDDPDMQRREFDSFTKEERELLSYRPITFGALESLFLASKATVNPNDVQKHILWAHSNATIE